jgi:hypothetical protein
MRSENGTNAQDIVNKWVKSRNADDARELNELNLNIFDILALVFENPTVQFTELPIPLSSIPIWSKIEEIRRNVSTKKTYQCLLRIIDYVEEKEEDSKEQKEMKQKMLVENVKRVVSRCVLFAARPLLLTALFLAAG